MLNSSKPIYILGIESSCDDTSVAVLCNEKVCSNVVANQEIHAAYGGVVPELASRAHQQHIIPVVDKALKEANIHRNEISAIAFTQGPGLVGSLLVGCSFAKSLAMVLDIPLLGVNHMQGHILAHFIEDAHETPPSFPFLCLTISGGHTQLVKVNSHLSMEIIGETLDDAVGEAFDKSAKMLGLSYPGGPLIDTYAQKGNPAAFIFPKPRVPDLNFSFSGLKTAIANFIAKEKAKNEFFVKEHLNDLCASIQQRIVTILMEKIEKAVVKTGIKSIAIAGGVSANSSIRSQLKKTGEEQGWDIYIPPFPYTTDNGAMIAIAGYYQLKEGKIAPLTVVPAPRMPF